MSTITTLLQFFSEDRISLNIHIKKIHTFPTETLSPDLYLGLNFRDILIYVIHELMTGCWKLKLEQQKVNRLKRKLIL